MFSLKKKVLIMVVVFVILISLTNITFAEKTYNYADTVATVSLLNEYSASTIIASLHQNATAVYAYSSLKCGSTTLNASADSGRGLLANFQQPHTVENSD